MARLEADINPALLVWARRSVRMSIETAAKKIGVAPDRLRSWESGDAKPTINQLWHCASVYKRPLAAFFLPEAPPLPEGLHDFRRSPAAAHEGAMAQIEIEARRAILSREHVLDLADELGDDIPSFGLSTTISADPERVAAHARDLLQIDLQQQVTWSDSYRALRSWIQAVEQCGALVFQASRISSEAMRGLSIANDRLPIILLNGGETPNGRIFTLMHEFAHLLLHRGGICDTTEYRGDTSPNQRTERFCNRFAASLLVPPESLYGAVEKPGRITKPWLDATTKNLADKYRVSRQVIIGRLHELGFVTQSTYDGYLKQLQDEFAVRKQQKSSGGGNFYKTTVRNNGLAFTRVVLEAHGQGLIDLGHVCEYLNIKVKHLEGVHRELRRVG